MLFIVGLVIFGVGCLVVIFHEAWISRAVRIWSSAYACDKYVSADSVFPDLDNHLVHVISKTRTDDVAQPGAMSAAQSPAQSDAHAAAVFVPVDAGGSEAKSAGSPTVSGASSAHTHSAALTDPDLHLPFPDCVRFKRIVEMWQWTKAPHTLTGYEGNMCFDSIIVLFFVHNVFTLCFALLGVWSSDLIDSRRFPREFQNVAADKRPPIVSVLC